MNEDDAAAKVAGTMSPDEFRKANQVCTEERLSQNLLFIKYVIYQFSYLFHIF